MNKINDKTIYNFLKKLNTLTNYRDLSSQLAKDLLYVTHAFLCTVCLISPANGKIILKKNYCSALCDKKSLLFKEAENTFRVAEELLTSNFETEDAIDYFNSVSQDKIIEPVIYNNNLFGFVALAGFDNTFYKNNIILTGIFMENVNSRLEIINLFEEKEKNLKERIEFLASISHEFKTPLNSTIGFSDILKLKWAGKENYKYADNISKSSRFLLSLIQDVLDVARAESKPMELKYSVFSPSKIISDIIWSFEKTCRGKNIKFNYTLSNVEISADLKRFQQLIYNLISNAVKFSKQDGIITIVTYINEKHEFVFEIKDTGDGISKKDCDKIFNFFSQVNRNQLKRQQGSGVGLAVCKTIAKAHGGDIKFKSRLNHGSTFWFTIPQKF